MATVRHSRRSSLIYVSSALREQGVAGKLFTFSLWLSDERARPMHQRSRRRPSDVALDVFSLFGTANVVQSAGFGMFHALCVSLSIEPAGIGR